MIRLRSRTRECCNLDQNCRLSLTVLTRRETTAGASLGVLVVSDCLLRQLRRLIVSYMFEKNVRVQNSVAVGLASFV